MGGFVPLGYEAKDRSLVINEAEAETVRIVYRLYLEHGNVRRVKEEADRLGLATKSRPTGDGKMRGGWPLSRGYIYKLLGNPLYAGRIAHKSEVYEGLHAAIIDAETWDAVQTKLAGNALDRRAGNGAREPSLLAGILHDERGNRLSPSHAVKNGVRYRYYVSQALLQNRDGEAGSIVRIPAREIEELVATRIAALLKDSGLVIDELGESLAPRDKKRLMTAARNQAEQWPRMSGSEQRAFVLGNVTDVTVGEMETRIVLRRNELRHSLLGDGTSIDLAGAPMSQVGGDALTLHVSTRLKLCSGEMRLVIPPGNARERRPRINAALIKALTRAHDWNDQLFSGRTPSIQIIAKAEGVTPRYVGRILRLAFLAPDIIEAILDGYQPADLELERFRKGIPIGWHEQRRVLGFSRS